MTTKTKPTHHHNSSIPKQQHVKESYLPCCPSTDPERQRVCKTSDQKNLTATVIHCQNTRETPLTKQRTHNTKSVRHLLDVWFF